MSLSGRLRRRLIAAIYFTVGATLAAALTYGLIGWVGTIFPPVAAAISLLAFAGSFVWHLAGRRRVPWGHEHVQARRDLALRGVEGKLYFGAILGIGLLTDMATPLVYGGAALALSLGAFNGATYGVGFGLGRAIPAWFAAGLGRRFSPGTVAARMIGATSVARWPGMSVAAGGIYVSLLGAGLFGTR